jgi:hypothetical protein
MADLLLLLHWQESDASAHFPGRPLDTEDILHVDVFAVNILFTAASLQLQGRYKTGIISRFPAGQRFHWK